MQGYKEISPLNDSQRSLLEQLLSGISSYIPQAAEGYRQFLPGGGGGQAFINQANQNYSQNTLPSILNALGSESGRNSSPLNQAVAASAANLNTDLAAQLAQMQLQASQGLGNLGLSGSNIGLGTQTKGYLQKQPSFWQQILLGLIGKSGPSIGSGIKSIFG